MAASGAVGSDSWQCLRPAEIALSEWDDGAVVFDDASAQLSALSSVAGAALSLLLDGRPRSTREVTVALLGDEAAFEDDDLVQNHLMHLQSLLLVQRIVA